MADMQVNESKYSSDIYNGISVGMMENSNSPLPLLIKPENENFDLKNWISENKPTIELLLHKHGGILFRGFGIDSIDAFNSLMACYSSETIPYMFRSSPRYSLADRVYVSTTHPQQREIKMHSESSYSFAWGKKILFCCVTEPTDRGETPIADNRKVLNHLSEDIINKFESLGVIYQRNLSSEIGMSVKEVFQMETEDEITAYCKENNIDIEFSSPDDAVIRWKRPAIVYHPVTKEKIWFNHSYFFNKYSILEEIGLSHDDDSLDDYLASNTFFGDGSVISYEEYQEIENAYNKEKVVFTWKKGDVLFLDNMLTAHGRSPYTGERKIVVSIIEPYNGID
jgi:alpha-ketoglutarate-dependent taurine dioxygenase